MIIGINVEGTEENDDSLLEIFLNGFPHVGISCGIAFNLNFDLITFPRGVCLLNFGHNAFKWIPDLVVPQV